VVRGARILATLAPFADELAVYPAFPLPEGADAYGVAFCVSMDAPGLKFLCRDSCSLPGSRFNHPLSTRFDEQDAFVIFDNVEIPRDRIFINANREVYNAVMSTGWYPNIMQQTMIRAQTKLAFAYGLGTMMAEAINDVSPPTHQMLGEIWSYSQLVRAAVENSEANAFEYGNGVWFPDGRALSALRAILPTWFPRVGEILTLIGSHNLLATPSEGQFADAKLRLLIERYLRGAGDVKAEDRARLFRLAWDFVGTALAGRNELYERFYLASGARNFVLADMIADKERPRWLVDQILGTMGAAEKMRPAPDTQIKANLPWARQR